MTALPGMPSTPADVWSGDGVWHVSAVARLLVPDSRLTRPARTARRTSLRVPRPRSAADAQRAVNTPAG
jgi:hypothetical protein